jgi:hypothetical protein
MKGMAPVRAILFAAALKGIHRIKLESSKEILLKKVDGYESFSRNSFSLEEI